MRAPQVVCVGEVLWDVLPHGEFLGGAPLNVCAHLRRLGIDAGLVSRVGRDARGDEARRRISALGIDTGLIQVDRERPTGTAEAILAADGSATYAFPSPAAWDALESRPETVDRARDAVVVYGTLAQRSPASREAVREVVGAARLAVFDANLRHPHDDERTGLSALALAHFVKLNDDEVTRFAQWLGSAPDADSLWTALQTRYGVQTLCVTEGARGAKLWHGDERIGVEAIATVVCDTIGAGDAFLAMLLAGLLCGASPQDAMQRATRLASFVASQPGAIPEYEAATFTR